MGAGLPVFAPARRRCSGTSTPHALAAPASTRITTDPTPIPAPATDGALTRQPSRARLIRKGLLAADLVALAAALAATRLAGPTPVGARTAAAAGLGIVLAWVAAASLHGLYEDGRLRAEDRILEEFWPAFHASTVTAWLAGVGEHLVTGGGVATGPLLAFWATAVVGVPVVRAGAHALLRRHGSYTQSAVVVGAGLVGQEIARKIIACPSHGVRLVGFVDDDPLPLHRDLADIPVLGGADRLREILRAHDVDRVVVAFTGDGHEVGLDLVRACNDLDVQVDIVPRLFEVVGSRAAFYTLQGTVLLGLTAPRLGAAKRLAKRSMDVVGAAAGMLLLAPVFVAAAVAIKLSGPGPVFFRQTRMGRGHRPFRIYKFRTMIADAEQRKADVMHLNGHHALGDTRMFKIADDPRITPVGKLLRRTSIDELPQLINVLKGEMSLVGPRPLILDEHQYVNSWGLKRLDLTPGLTGLWQVSGRSEIPFSQMLVLDYLYVTNWSLWGDIKLVIRTVPVLLGRGRGAL